MNQSAPRGLTRPGDRILMVSYGSGAGSDGFIWRVTDAITEVQKLAPQTRVNLLSPGWVRTPMAEAELKELRDKLLEMGGLVESQVAQAVYALVNFSGETATQVLQQEEVVNRMEVEIDRDLSAIIARRQPTARDLRLLIAVSKTIGNLERIGDEAARIARTVQRLLNSGVSSRMRLPVSDLAFESELATNQLRKVLDAFARLDTEAALDVLKHDDQIDREFDGLLRKLIQAYSSLSAAMVSCQYSRHWWP